MKSLEICDTAMKAGLSDFGKIKYRTGDDWRYNVMLWTGDHWSCDCLGFVHTMVNGFCGDRTKLGGGAVMDSFVTNATENVTLWDYCYEQSQDFRNKIPGELLYMSGHVGLLIPETEDSVAAGDDVTVQVKDIGLWTVGAAVDAGALLMSDANGKAVAATAGKFVLAQALEAATAAGQVIHVQIIKAGYVPGE